MPSQIELYEAMSLLSSRMVAAARASDWDSLIELERRIAGLRNTLMAVPEDSNALATDSAHKRALIQRILEDDAEVRRHTEPWMERLRQFLGDGTHYRDMQQDCAVAAEDSSPAGFGT
ncbi:MAG: flagellar protein FliT [Rhodocyclales bacterium]|nr:flagellar protein FliT [Rhodocyclales bacterium]